MAPRRFHRTSSSLVLSMAVLAIAAAGCRDEAFDITVVTVDGREARETVVTFPGFEFDFGWVGSGPATRSQCVAQYPLAIQLSWIDDINEQHAVRVLVPQEMPAKYPEDRYELVIEIDGPAAKARIAVDDTPSSLRRMPEDRTLYKGSDGAAHTKSTDPPPPG